MSLVKNYQEIILKIVNNYLHKFPVYKSEDFKQDVWVKIIEKEDKIVANYKNNAQKVVTFESYLGRTVINICKDLGTREYAKVHQKQQNQIDIQETRNISAESCEDNVEEHTQTLLMRINKALEHKSFEKSKAKIRLYMDLKQGDIDKKSIKNVFVEINEKIVNKSIKKLRRAKNEIDIFEAITMMSGKTAKTEQRWFNYQLAKLREMVNPSNK